MASAVNTEDKGLTLGTNGEEREQREGYEPGWARERHRAEDSPWAAIDLADDEARKSFAFWLSKVRDMELEALGEVVAAERVRRGLAVGPR